MTIKHNKLKCLSLFVLFNKSSILQAALKYLKQKKTAQLMLGRLNMVAGAGFEPTTFGL
jgi:hypothetical protein